VDGCDFCQIVKGEEEEEAAIAYEDGEHICIRHPINPGHMLVMPKKHYATLLDMPSPEVGKLFTLVADMAKSVVRVMKADGFNVGQNNGAVARQLVFHVHVHIIPRYLQDASEGHFPTRKKTDIDELRRLASLICGEVLKNLKDRHPK